MLSVREKFFPGDEPEIEIIDGRRVAKMSPKRRHAEAQGILVSLLRTWAIGRGRVGTEWRFRVSGERSRRDSYVPDVAFLSNERFYALAAGDRDEPPFAPDVVIEIHSPGDREANVARKIERYLAFGAKLVIDVRPHDRALIAHDAEGSRRFCDGDTFVHAALPAFELAVAALFDEIEPPEAAPR